MSSSGATAKNSLELVPKSPASKKIAVQIVFIVMVYAFFFLTPTLFSNLNDYLLTEIGSREEVEPNKYVTLNAWRYSPSDRTMEVELGFENLRYDGKNDCYFSSNSRGMSVEDLGVEEIISSGDLFVVHITGLPSRWNEVVLRVASEQGSVSLFTNKRDVERVGEITAKTEKEYRINSLQRRIDNLNAEIESCNAEIEAAKERIANINLDIAKLKADERYQTAKEIEETERTITNLQGDILNENKSIDGFNADIEEYEARIELVNQEISDIENGVVVSEPSSPVESPAPGSSDVSEGTGESSSSETGQGEEGPGESQISPEDSYNPSSAPEGDVSQVPEQGGEIDYSEWGIGDVPDELFEGGGESSASSAPESVPESQSESSPESQAPPDEEYPAQEDGGEGGSESSSESVPEEDAEQVPPEEDGSGSAEGSEEDVIPVPG